MEEHRFRKAGVVGPTPTAGSPFLCKAGAGVGRAQAVLFRPEIGNRNSAILNPYLGRRHTAGALAMTQRMYCR